jgi:hypothetical protein
MAATTFAAAVSSVTDWLRQRPTPVCWLAGPPGAGKTAVVRAVRAAAGRTRTAPLSAASPDRCLHHAFGDRTTAGVGARLDADTAGLLVLDALDTVQDPDDDGGGRVTDPRLRLLLSAAARHRWPGVSTLVTSRLRPGRDLPADGATVIELAAPDPAAGAGPSIGSGHAAVLEVLASSRQASSGWLLGLLTGHPTGPPSLATPAAVRAALADALTAGIVDRVEFEGSGEWFQMSDATRPRFLPPGRAAAVHAAVAAGLESDAVLRHAELTAGADPALPHDLLERAIEHRLAAGEIHAAVQCYWDRLGNYARLDRLNDSPRGARVCRALNAGRPPHEVSPVLRQSPGAFAVINDWGLYATRAGAAELAAAAAVTTVGLVGDDQPPWNLSTLARHAAEAHLACGRLPEGMSWAARAKEHARAGLRQTEGLPTAEGMDAYDHAFYAIMTIAAAGGDAAGPAHVLDEMVAAHERAQEVLANYNRHAPFPVPGPTGEVNAEGLLDGRPAALVALLDGRAADAVRILAAQVAGRPESWPESNKGLAVHLLLLRAQLAAGRHNEARDLLRSGIRGASRQTKAASRLLKLSPGKRDLRCPRRQSARSPQCLGLGADNREDTVRIKQLENLAVFPSQAAHDQVRWACLNNLADLQEAQIKRGAEGPKRTQIENQRPAGGQVGQGDVLDFAVQWGVGYVGLVIQVFAQIGALEAQDADARGQGFDHQIASGADSHGCSPRTESETGECQLLAAPLESDDREIILEIGFAPMRDGTVDKGAHQVGQGQPGAAR